MEKVVNGTSLDKINVWVIEDDEFFRSILVSSLNRSDRMYCEHSFSTCEEALVILSKDHAPEIVLVDIVLPDGMNGIDGAKQIRIVSPSTQIMVLTGYADDDNVFKAICAGASGYLLKTDTLEGITHGIEEVMNGGASMNAQIARKVLDIFATTAAPEGSYGLTRREKEILNLMVDGLTKKRIADALFLSFYTIETHLKNIYAKMHVHSRPAAVAKALKEKIVFGSKRQI